MTKRVVLAILAAGVMGASCEKTINFKPAEADAVVVVEATIENDKAPVVILSKSLNYFSQISPDILAGSFIHNAQIAVSNGTKTHTLKEYAVTVANGYAVYYYSTDSSNLNTSFVGQLGHSYSISIKTNEKEYTATTTIPQLAKKIDSVWWVQAPSNIDSNKVVVMGRFVDPPGLGNYTRYFTQVDGWYFYPGLNSVEDDQLTDGTTYNMQIEKGIDRNKSYNLDEYAFFDHGDSVVVKYCNIDKATYDFWRTMEYSYSSIGNPFASPGKVLSNIQGGGLGYFGGYAAQYVSLVIPR